MKQGNLRFPRSAAAVGLLSLSVVFIGGCSLSKLFQVEQPSSVNQDQSAKMVKVAKVSRQKIGDPVEQEAEVQSSTQVGVLTKVGGDVKEILKKHGEPVQEGEVILRLTSTELTLQREKAVLALQSVQEAQSQAVKEQEKLRKDLENRKREQSSSILKQEQSLEDLTKKYNKTRNDYDLGLATKAQVEQAQNQLKTTQMDLNILKQQQQAAAVDFPPFSATALKNAEILLLEADRALQSLEVKAPISGILTEMPIKAGMTLGPGAKVGLIDKLDPVKIKANLSADAAKFVPGKKELTYYLPDGPQKFKGGISYLANIIDAQTKAYELNLEVPNPDMSLKPGMKVRVQLTDENEQNVIAIPTKSVVKEGNDSYVFVLSGDNTALKRRVELGRINEPIQEVLSGMKEDETIVISGQNQLKNNEKVELSNAQTAKK